MHISSLHRTSGNFFCPVKLLCNNQHWQQVWTDASCWEWVQKSQHSQSTALHPDWLLLEDMLCRRKVKDRELGSIWVIWKPTSGESK